MFACHVAMVTLIVIILIPRLLIEMICKEDVDEITTRVVEWSSCSQKQPTMRFRGINDNRVAGMAPQAPFSLKYLTLLMDGLVGRNNSFQEK